MYGCAFCASVHRVADDRASRKKRRSWRYAAITRIVGKDRPARTHSTAGSHAPSGHDVGVTYALRLISAGSAGPLACRCAAHQADRADRTDTDPGTRADRHVHSQSVRIQRNMGLVLYTIKVYNMRHGIRVRQTQERIKQEEARD